MSETIHIHPAAGAGEPAHGHGHLNYLTAEKGILSWIFTLDHKRIGVMYLALTTFSFLLGGIFALLIRTKLLFPKDFLVSPEVYNQLFTLHGAIMIFLFIIPSIPAALGNFFLPIMLGAKDVAFPRLNLASLYILRGRRHHRRLFDRRRRGRYRLDFLHALQRRDQGPALSP